MVQFQNTNMKSEEKEISRYALVKSKKKARNTIKLANDAKRNEETDELMPEATGVWTLMI